MENKVEGSFVTLDGEQFYRIENYYGMEDFFMTITSSSDIWNFCWAQGGITAGRINSDHAVFPYYTADKVSDAKTYTGSYTSIAVETNNGTCIWEPFAWVTPGTPAAAGITRTIYKNATGTKVWFEETNENLGLAFRYGWTSSASFGLVRMSRIENISGKAVSLAVLDGCRNILPACCTSDYQNNNSVLLDAYKKTETIQDARITLFTVSSVVTDKAEPNEGLFANVSWFTAPNAPILSPDAPAQFARTAWSQGISGIESKMDFTPLCKGKRPVCYICRELTLEPSGSDDSSRLWYQVFDTALDICRISELKAAIMDRQAAIRALEADIADGIAVMNGYIAAADGFQNTGDTLASAHHSANVMFNIMRGGIFADNGDITKADFLSFIATRNKGMCAAAEAFCSKLGDGPYNSAVFLQEAAVSGDKQLERLALEYLPVTFSRRHGDPSRPWNRFNIVLRDTNGEPILNYEGNWRDIFQNWEALCYSYPTYVESMIAKFLNAMTVDGYNPYRITKQGIDWEVPVPNDPWSAIGYWGDHQVIYLQKLLEFFNKTNRQALLNSLNDQRYATANVPYRIKSYAEICKNPRSTIDFDRELSNALIKESETYGTDAKLCRDKKGDVVLTSLTAKLLQILIAKAANFVPGGGIWLNTQRPEWNDANNALAGYGLSMVTLYYLRRFISFAIDMYTNTPIETFTIPSDIAACFIGLTALYEKADPKATATSDTLRRQFTDEAGLLYEKERTALYKSLAGSTKNVSREQILAGLKAILCHTEETIRLNRRADGLYHAYNTMHIGETTMELSYLQEMLEGQVAVLSSGMLSSKETLEVFSALRNSAMYEPHQNSYMLYPNKELPHFCNKNCVDSKALAEGTLLSEFVRKTGTDYLKQDADGVWHFNGIFRNSGVLEDYCNAHGVAADEKKALLDLYEKTFNHQNFTGRSGTFYAYEGLGSIYWHMVSKLLVAAQETVFAAVDRGETELAKELAGVYYNVRAGISFNKEPAVYGAFPCDPYSHTPYHQGAKQPGMTGQVKEEILTRFGELGVTIKNGIASFEPVLLRKNEFFADNTLNFTWCTVPVTYTCGKEQKITITFADDSVVTRPGCSLTAAESADLFARNGNIAAITVAVTRTAALTE